MNFIFNPTLKSKIFCIMLFLVAYGKYTRMEEEEFKRYTRGLASNHRLTDTGVSRQNPQIMGGGHGSVCLFAHTKLDVTNWEGKWLKSYFAYMKNILIRSLVRQCTSFSPCPSLSSFNYILRISGDKEELDNFLADVKELLPVIVVR